jgi:serine/threonine-protein kinase
MKLCPQCGDQYDDAVVFCARDGTRLDDRPRPTDLVGAIVADRYRVVSRLGEGGMGQVYLAEHVRMKRKSAIKIMRPALVGDADALQRFSREAENASKILHPNVAAIFDFGEAADGTVYLAMEYVDGESLAATLRREHALHPDVAADIIGQAADALQAAHDLGILHRDLKPDNLMLARRPDGTYLVKLVDFGIARTMDRGTQQVTRTGFAVGTPEYMSPEQLSGDTLDSRSDLYALALVAYVALTGQDAFANASSKESLIARLTSRPRRLAEVRTDVDWPEALQDVFDRALAPEPGDRYETVTEFGQALAAAISAMTPTQTAELYRRALDQRVAGIASRTPHSDIDRIKTPAAGLPTRGTAARDAKTVRQAERERVLASYGARDHRIAEPIGVPRRRGRLPLALLLLGGATWGVWWYGAKQPEGALRVASDRIGAWAGAVGTVVTPWVARAREAATPEPTMPVPAPGAAPERARRRRTADSAVDAGTVGGARPRIDSVAAKDSGAAGAGRPAPPDTTIPPG